MAVFNVAGSTQLLTALSNARAGDTISLSSGNYGALKLNELVRSLPSSGEVTITSANSKKPAVFTSLDLDNVTNLTFDGVKFDAVAGSAGGFNPFSAEKVDGLTIRNSVFDGHLVNGVGTEQGFWAKNSSNVTFENNGASTSTMVRVSIRSPVFGRPATNSPHILRCDPPRTDHQRAHREQSLPRHDKRQGGSPRHHPVLNGRRHDTLQERCDPRQHHHARRRAGEDPGDLHGQLRCKEWRRRRHVLPGLRHRGQRHLHQPPAPASTSRR